MLGRGQMCSAGGGFSWGEAEAVRKGGAEGALQPTHFHIAPHFKPPSSTPLLGLRRLRAERTQRAVGAMDRANKPWGCWAKARVMTGV